MVKFYLTVFVLSLSVIVAIAALDNYTRTQDGKFSISSGTVVAESIVADDIAIGTNAPITNWPSGGSTNLSEWATYPAISDVDINNKKLDNVKEINLGGISKTNWPAVGSGHLVLGEDGPTSILYHVTSGGHTNLIGYYYSQY
ncbi:hypothetical protein ACFLQL_00050 [Verrucomicrobiota bacterium]